MLPRANRFGFGKTVYFVKKDMLSGGKNTSLMSKLFTHSDKKSLLAYTISLARRQLKYVGAFCFLGAGYYFYSYLASPSLPELKTKLVSLALSPVKAFASELLNSKEVKGESIRLLDGIFREKSLHDTLLKLLKVNIKEKTFVDDSKIFGKEWIKTVVFEKDFKVESKELSVNIFKSQEMKTEGLVILNHVIADSQAKSDVAMYMQNVWLRKDVLGELNNLFMKSAVIDLNSEPTKQKATEFVSIMLSDKDFKWRMIYKVLPRFTTHIDGQNKVNRIEFH